MACAEKGIDYTLTEAELGSPEVFAIHPFGRMPVLRHGDFSLCESKAIITYLDRAFPSTPLGRYHQTHAARPSFVQAIPPVGPPRRYAPAG